jgi:hypothetical protein
MVAPGRGRFDPRLPCVPCPNGALPVVAARVERPMAIGGARLQLKFTGSE